jgi:hypothetical protein
MLEHRQRVEAKYTGEITPRLHWSKVKISSGSIQLGYMFLDYFLVASGFRKLMLDDISSASDS